MLIDVDDSANVKLTCKFFTDCILYEIPPLSILIVFEALQGQGGGPLDLQVRVMKLSNPKGLVPGDFYYLQAR